MHAVHRAAHSFEFVSSLPSQSLHSDTTDCLQSRRCAVSRPLCKRTVVSFAGEKMNRNAAEDVYAGHLPYDHNNSSACHFLALSEEEEDEDCYITFTTSESRCDDLFDRGLDMVAQGDPSSALSIFLETLTALQECQYFNKLLPTLYQIGENYRVLGEEGRAQEISSTVSVLQEILNEAVIEKWRGRKKQGRRNGSMFSESQQPTDCGALFLKKAKDILCELRERDDKENVTYLAENAFRIVQFTLGPCHPETLESLRELMALYTGGSVFHITHCLEPIIFTATIKSLCTQFSEQNATNSDESAMSSLSLTLSGITLTQSSPSEPMSDITSSLLHWSSDDSLSSLSSSSGTEGSPHHPNSTTEEQKEEKEDYLTAETPLLSPHTHTPGAQLEGSHQDVVMDRELWCGDKEKLECNVPSCSSGLLNPHIFPLSLCESTNLAPVFILFVVFGLTAVAVLSVDIF